MSTDHFEPARILDEALRRMERRVESIASLSRANALLALADPAFVLPRPALALVAVDAAPTQPLRASHWLRCRSPRSGAAELLFAPLHPSAVVHPWRVCAAEWVDEFRPADAGAAPRGALATALRVVLERDPALACTAGWLSLHVEGGPALGWALGECRASARGRLLETRSLTEVLSRSCPGFDGEQWPLRFVTDALASNLLEVNVPAVLAREYQLELELHFVEAVLAGVPPSAHANAILFWNSIAQTSPGPEDVEQAVTGLSRTRVHPLSTASLGPGWQAWSVTAISEPGPRAVRGDAGRRMPPAIGHHLAVVPYGATVRRPSSEAPTLSVVIDDPAAYGSGSDDPRPAIDFMATQGTAANGLERGSRLQLLESPASLVGTATGATALQATWGGSDGFVGTRIDGEGEEWLQALLPSPRTRRVPDVGRVLGVLLGNELALVDEWDLLRRNEDDVTQPLFVRVRFLRPERTATERRAITVAAQGFLSHYLEGGSAGSIVLSDVEPCDEDAS